MTRLNHFVVVLTAQEVEIKDNKVMLDGRPILKSEKINGLQYSFYSLENDDELLMYKQMDNETPRYTNDDFFILNFLTEKKKVESKDFGKIAKGFGLNSRKNMQNLIGWLLKEKVFTPDGEIDKGKLEIFYNKYNENITERTIR